MPESVEPLLKRLGIDLAEIREGRMAVHSPIDGTKIAAITAHTPAQARKIIDTSIAAFHTWKSVPAPVRGELVRLYGEELRAAKNDLSRLTTIECGRQTLPIM